MKGAGRRFEAGFGLVGALAGITVMLILMAVAMPAWRYVMQDDREEELIFRGTQIADAIARCQRESRSLPVSLEFLVQKKFLRKAYKDPMSKSGRRPQFSARRPTHGAKRATTTWGTTISADMTSDDRRSCPIASPRRGNMEAFANWNKTMQLAKMSRRWLVPTMPRAILGVCAGW